MLAMVARTHPDLLPWVQWCYGSDTNLFFGDKVLSSSEGVQQGDPLGPALFALTIVDLINSLEQFGLDANLWYLDDGVLAGDEERVAAAYAHLSEGLRALGLEINVAKTEVVRFGGSSGTGGLPSGAKCLRDNFAVLGSPIGDRDYVRSYVRSKVLDKVRAALDRLTEIDDPHVEYCVLRQCLAFGPLVHIMRTVPPDMLVEVATEYDSMIQRHLERVVGTRFSKRAWRQAGLSTKAGGLGLRSCASHLESAFIAGCFQAAHHDGWDPASDEAFTIATASFSKRFPGTDMSAEGLTQKVLSHVVEEADFESLLRDAPSLLDRARLQTVHKQDAGLHWSVIPSEFLHLAIPAAHFRVLVKWWLGLDVYPARHRCPRPGCTKQCDTAGYHSLVCRFGGDLGVRHNAVRNVVAHAARAAAMAPRTEQAILPSSQARPADLLLPGDPAVACDFAVTHPLQDAYISGTADGTGSAPERYAHQHKTAKWGAAVRAETYDFKPCVVDAYGNWCDAGREVLNLVAVHASFRDGKPSHVHLRQLLQKCAVALMLSNARALLQRSDPLLEDDGSMPPSGVYDPLDDEVAPAARETQIAAGVTADARPT
jgi:hypothetical protein